VRSRRYWASKKSESIN